MKFKRVSSLQESNNTNLRKFLIAAAEYAEIDVTSLVNAPDINKVVVHHIKKDRSANGIDELVLMSDEQHRKMHARYRFKEWNEQAHQEYDHVPVKEIISKLTIRFIQQSEIDEHVFTTV